MANMLPAIENVCGKQTPSDRKPFFERICYMFQISKCRGVWDLSLCTFWVLTKREPLRNAKFWFFSAGETRFFFGSRHCATVLFLQVQPIPLLFQSECCFKAESLKLERHFLLKRGKRDARALSFELLKMSPQVGLAVPKKCIGLDLGSSIFWHQEHIENSLGKLKSLKSFAVRARGWGQSLRKHGKTAMKNRITRPLQHVVSISVEAKTSVC